MAPSKSYPGYSDASNHIVRSLLAAGADELDQALQSAIEHAARTAGAEHSMIALAARDKIEVLATLGPDRAAYESRVAKAVDGCPNPAEKFPFLANCFVHGNVIRVSVVANLPDSARLERQSFEECGVQSFLLLPLRSETSVIGVQIFESVSAQREWSDGEVAELQHLAEMIGIAIARRSRRSERAKNDSAR